MKTEQAEYGDAVTSSNYWCIYLKYSVSSSDILSTGWIWTCWNGCRGGHQDAQRAAAPLLSSQAERAGGAQLGEVAKKTLQHLK